MAPLFAAIFVWACSAPDTQSGALSRSGLNTPVEHRAGGSAASDSDGDGSPDAVDCAPNDRYSFPGAVEHCDGVDNDCDGTVDFGTHALRLVPGDTLETTDPAPQLGPARGPLTISFRIRAGGQAGTPVAWLGEGVGYAVTFGEPRNYPRVVVVPDDPANTHETNNRDNILPSRWTHVSVVLQPGTKDEDAKVVLYLDGVRYNPHSLPSTFDLLDLSADNSLRLSAEQATGEIWIDELRFWSRSSNRTTLLPNMCGDLDGDEDALIAYFPFESDFHDHGPHQLQLSVTSGTPQLAPL